jgi:hypothetical protein
MWQQTNFVARSELPNDFLVILHARMDTFQGAEFR